MRLLYTLLLFQLTINIHAQKVDDRIQKIDEHCNQIIRQLSTCSHSVVMSDSQGNRINYACFGTTKVITIKVQQDSILKNVIWILEENRLIFAGQEWLNVKTNRIVDIQKFYLENQSLIGWLTNNSFVASNSVAFTETAKELQDYIPKLLKQ